MDEDENVLADYGEMVFLAEGGFQMKPRENEVDFTLPVVVLE